MAGIHLEVRDATYLVDLKTVSLHHLRQGRPSTTAGAVKKLRACGLMRTTKLPRKTP
jgi:hypothetical protein